MCDALLEYRLLRGDVVHVRVEEITADACEIDDVAFGDRPSMGDQSVADLELIEILSEGMNSVGGLSGTLDPFLRNTSQCRRRSLERRTLHVVKRAACAAELFAAACAPRSTVHETRKGRAMAGRCFCRRAIADHDAAVMRCGSKNDLSGDVGIGREHRADEAS